MVSYAPAIIATSTNTRTFAGSAATTITVGSPATAIGQLLLITWVVETTNASNGGTSISATTGSWTTVVSNLVNSTRSPAFTFWMFRKTAVAADLGATYTISTNAGGTGNAWGYAAAASVAGVNAVPRSVSIASQAATNSTSLVVSGATTYQAGDVPLSFAGLQTDTNVVSPAESVVPVDADTSIGMQGEYHPNGAYGIGAFFATSTGGVGDRSFTLNRAMRRVAGQLVLIGVPYAAHPGGTPTGSAKLAGRGYKSLLRVRSSNTGTTTVAGTGVTHVLPASIVDGDALYLIANVSAGSAGVASATMSDPPGFGLYAAYTQATTNLSTIRTYVWRRIGLAAMAGTTITIAMSTTNNFNARVMSFAVNGVVVDPRVISLAGYSVTSTNPMTMSAVSGAQTGDVVLDYLMMAQDATSIGTATAVTPFSTTYADSAATDVAFVNGGGLGSPGQLLAHSLPASNPQFAVTPSGVTVVGVWGQLALKPGVNLMKTGRGGAITGYPRLKATPWRNPVSLRYATSNQSQTITLPAASVMADGDSLLWVLQVINTTATVQASDVTVPTGWTAIIDTINGANTTQRLIVMIKPALASQAGTTATATPVTSTNMGFISHLMVLKDAAYTPRATAFTLGGSTTYNATTPVVVPAETGTVATDVVVSIVTAMMTASGVTNAWTPQPTGGVIWSSVSAASGTAYNGSSQVTMARPGAQTFYPANTLRAMTAQLAFSKLVTILHSGGTITGYAKIITRTSGTKKITQGRGGAITGYAQIACQRGTYTAKPSYHKGTIIGYFAEQPNSSVYKRVRPHLRKHAELVQVTNSSGQQVMVSQQLPTVQVLTQDSATSLSFTIPADTQPTDMIFIEVGFAGGTEIDAPDGWQQLDAAPAGTSAVHATFYKSADWDDASTTVIITGVGSPAQMEGVLAVYTPGIIDTASSNTMATGSTRVVFGPTTQDAGTTRIMLGTFRATLSGDQIAFTKPLNVLNGAIAATPAVQEANNSSLSLGSVVADYSGTTNLQGQLTAQVPVLGRMEVVDVEGVEFHRGTISQNGHLSGGSGVKHATDGTNQYARIEAYFGRTTPNDHSGAHTDIGAAGAPGHIDGFAVLDPGPGLKYDSYHGGRIDGYQQLTFMGRGDHDTGYGGEIHQYGHIYVHRGSQLAKHPGGAITGYAQMHGEGHRTWMHPGAPIIGYASMRGISGSTRVNVIKAYAQMLAEHEADHSDRLAKGGPGRIKGYAALYGSGTAQAAIDERYTQIRGYAVINGRGIAGTVRPYGIGGTITGYAVLEAYDLTPKTPEDIGVDITLGPVIVVANVIDGPEDFELSIITGRPTVLRLVPYEMFKSSAYYGGGSRPNTVGVRATRAGSGSVFRTDPGYPFTTGTGQAYDGIEGTGP